jgi:DNA-binding CsgD family transcriptional regulator
VAATAQQLLDDATTSMREDRFDDAVAAAEAALALEDLGMARYLLGGAYYLDERFPEATEQWQQAFRLLRAEGLLLKAASAAMGLADLEVGGGRPSTAQGWLERARGVLHQVGPCAEWGHLELAIMACDRLDIPDLIASAERALAIAIEFGDTDLEAQALADLGLGLVTDGRAREGFARVDAALAAITAGEVSSTTSGMCFCSMLTACDRAGDLRRAEEWTAVIDGVLEQSGGRPRLLKTHCRLAYGSVLCASGRWEEAEALLLEALGPAEAPAVAHRATALAHLASLRVDQGRPQEAADLLAPFIDVVTSCGPLARAHLLQGEVDLAAAVLHRGLDEMVGDTLRQAPLLASLVEVELRRQDVEAARGACAALTSLAEHSDQEVLRAEAARADGRIHAALGDWPGATQALTAAKAHLAGGERPFLLGLVRLELAETRARAGDAPGAISEARAALACFERLGARPARDQAAALLRSLGDTGRTRPQDQGQLAGSLTKRETEVLDLITEGLTNAEIAARLFISPKTAEHHVGRVLTKLGVRSRAEAAALAVRLAADPPPVGPQGRK